MNTMRLVFDTNVLIDGFQDDFSAPAKLIEATLDGEVEAVTTSATQREYRKILRRLIDDPEYASRINNFLGNANSVTPKRVDVVIDDAEDQKFIEAAMGGEAEMIVTSDKHLLDVGEVDHVRIVTPQEAWAAVEEETGGSSQWQQFAKGLGIGG